MIVAIIHIWVKPEKIEEFIQATIENHQGSIQEPGIYRFDFLQEAEDPAKFTLYEVYESEEAILAHKQTAHYHKWRDSVADWMAKDRRGIKHHVLAPTQKENW